MMRWTSSSPVGFERPPPSRGERCRGAACSSVCLRRHSRPKSSVRGHQGMGFDRRRRTSHPWWNDAGQLPGTALRPRRPMTPVDPGAIALVADAGEARRQAVADSAASVPSKAQQQRRLTNVEDATSRSSSSTGTIEAGRHRARYRRSATATNCHARAKPLRRHLDPSDPLGFVVERTTRARTRQLGRTLSRGGPGCGFEIDPGRQAQYPSSARWRSPTTRSPTA